MNIKINDKEIKFTTISKWLSDGDRNFRAFYRQGMKRWNYRIKATIDGRCILFTWHDSIKSWKDNENTMTDEKYLTAFCCVLNDAIDYANASSVEDFAQEFGYEVNRQTRKIYEMCRESYDNLRNIFTDEEIIDIVNAVDTIINGEHFVDKDEEMEQNA